MKAYWVSLIAITIAHCTWAMLVVAILRYWSMGAMSDQARDEIVVKSVPLPVLMYFVFGSIGILLAAAVGVWKHVVLAK